MQTLLVLSLVVSCWLQSVQAVSPCDDCPDRNGVYVRNHQSECCKYINCERNLADDTFIEHVMQCPPKLFWDNTAMSCNYPTALKTLCGNDLCASKVDGSKVEDQCYCYGYYTCYNGVSTSRSSCLHGQRFDSSTGNCVADSTCKGGTPVVVAFDPCDGIPNGNKIPDVHTCHGYYICINGVKSHWYSCGVGQKFNTATGNCEADASCVHPEAPTHGCDPSTNIDFSSDDWRFKNVDLQTVDGKLVGYFDGTNSFLSLPTYTNMDDKAVFMVSITFKELSTDTDSYVLFSNCDCSGSDACSIRSSFKKDGDDIEVKAEVDTTDTASRQGIDVTLPNSAGDWKTHTYIFDHGKLTNGVDATFPHNNFGGLIENRQIALHIGKDGCSSTMKSFHGYIDQLTIWTCIPW